MHVALLPRVHRGLLLSLMMLIAFTGCGGGRDQRRSGLSPSEHDGPSDVGLSDLGLSDVGPSDLAGQDWFEDVAEAMGVTFTHDSGDPSDYFMPKNMGSGAALFDADNDGRLDIFCVQHGQPPFSSSSRFFLQQADGNFVDATTSSGLGLKGRGTGVAAGDVNNDGLSDLLVTFYDQARLMLNSGDGHFTDVTDRSGLENPLWGTSAAFVDFDRDGWLDVVIANYLAYSGSRTCFDSLGQRDFCSPHSFGGTAARLFRNTTGDEKDPTTFSGPTFVDVTVSSGLAAKTAPGLGVLCADFDGDHWPDILIANDGQPNHLWINRRNGKFEDQAALRGMALSALGKPFADMGIACGDVDLNGLFDIYITHLTNESHSLWLQPSAGFFVDATAQLGLSRASWRGTGFGVGMADFNHDGWLDLAQVNGRVRRGSENKNQGSVVQDTDPISQFWQPYAERNQLFAGRKGGRFVDISDKNPTMCGRANLGRGLATGDFDNDGDIDLLLTPIDAPAQLLRNTAPKQGHWLSVRAVLPTCGGRDAIGATITLQTREGQRVGMVQAASSYQSSSDPRVHFGLGDLDSMDHIDVRWPDGRLERFPGCGVDQQITLQCGQGSLLESD